MRYRLHGTVFKITISVDSLQLLAISPWKQDHAKDSSKTGTITRNRILASRSCMEDARATRIGLPLNKPVAINAKSQA